ncbi:MAG TPA: terminase family protein [Bryobacteraceae bacterium]|nr:terminase family protein [Bryobacteraceae bacterium]
MLALEPEAIREEILSRYSEAQLKALRYDWDGYKARPNQIIPPGAWRLWLIQAGRGWGKTRTGAEAVRKWVKQGYRRFHLVGATAGDTRDVMVQGESGLLNCFPSHLRPVYEPSKRLITFYTGAVAYLFSADEPERLRGPQCEAFWADEIAAWRFGQDAWDNLMFGFRLGNDPRGVITTTPKPIQLLKDIIKDPHTFLTRSSSYENRTNLAPAFFDSIIRKYEGTRLGRQELEAELLEDIPGALWTRAVIDAYRIKLGEVRWDMLVRIVVAIDPAVSAGENSDETGIVICGLARSGHVVVIEDLTCKESPLQWARIAVGAYKKYGADRIVGEVNNGGDLVEANIRAVAPEVSFRAVRASRGKAVRAEPVAALYEQGRVHHVGSMPQLEDQMCGYVPGIKQDSPDRMDALVWAITELLIDQATEQFMVMQDIYQISQY